MATSELLINSSTRHQVFTERLKTGEANKLTGFLVNVRRDLAVSLSVSALSSLSRARSERLLVGVNEMLRGHYDGFTSDLVRDSLEIAQSEAGFLRRQLDEAVDKSSGFESVLPAPSQVRSAVLSSPLAVRGPGGGLLLEAWLSRWSVGQAEMVTGAIRQGFFEGQTNAQIVSNIRGNILDISRRSAESVVRTGVQHAATQARLETMRENDLVIGYRWVATLDQRTCQVCAPLDGRVFRLDKGPAPPLHPNCRCTQAPELDARFDFLDAGATRSAKDGPVGAKKTYYAWLKDQPKEFQAAAIGPTRAKLLRDGGLSAERFARLGLDRNFAPLTLDEMRSLEPLAFVRAGI